MASQRIGAFISSRMQELAAERAAIKTSLNDLQVDTFRVGPDRSPAVTRTAFLETGPSLARCHTPLILVSKAAVD